MDTKGNIFDLSRAALIGQIKSFEHSFLTQNVNDVVSVTTG